VLRTAAERRRAHVLLDEIAEHVSLDDKQRALLAEIRALLPTTAALAATNGRTAVSKGSRKRPARASRSRIRSRKTVSTRPRSRA
jgi:hypothetical protein